MDLGLGSGKFNNSPLPNLPLSDVREEFFSFELEFKDYIFRQGDSSGIRRRQQVFTDFLRDNSLKSLFTDTVDSLDSFSEDAAVKYWRKEKSSWGPKKVPVVYDPHKLQEYVKEFRDISERVVEGMQHVQSSGLIELREYFLSFTDPESEISQHFSRQKELLTQEDRPFLGFIEHDTFANEIERIVPLAFVVNPKDLEELIEEGIDKDLSEATLRIGDKEVSVSLTQQHFMLKEKKHRVTHPRKRYADFEIYDRIFPLITEVKNSLAPLRFYYEGLDMHSYFRERGLPMTIPKISDSKKVIDVKDVYPFYELLHGLDPEDVVFNSYRLDEDTNVALVTGPNAGGKSSLLRTMGSIAYLAKLGLTVPGSSVEVSNFDKVHYHEAPSDDYTNHLSTFQSQTHELKRNLSELDPRGNELMLLNEPIYATDAADAKQGLLDVVRVLSELYETPTFIETHNSGASEEVLANPDRYSKVDVVRFAYDAENDKPLFKLEQGLGASEGRRLLREEGLDFESLKQDYFTKLKSDE